MATWDDVQRLARELSGTELLGEPPKRTVTCMRKNLAWERPYSRADVKRETAAGEVIWDGAILAVATPDVETANAYVQMEPEKYFRTQHFAGYPAVLCRLERLVDEDLRELFFEARMHLVVDRGLAAN